MSSSFTKLFASILDSTIWQQPDHVRIVWITLLAKKDRDGLVEASIPGLARAAGKTIAEVEDALRVLMAPDPYSRTPDHEGRRIAPIEGGWRLLNSDKYNEKSSAEDYRQKAAARQARRRARALSRDTTAESRDIDEKSRDGTAEVTHSHAPSRSTRTELTSDAALLSQKERETRARELDPGSGSSTVARSDTSVATRAHAPPAVLSPPADAAMRLAELRRVEQDHAERYNRLRQALGLHVPALNLAGEGERWLVEVLKSRGDTASALELAVADCRHVLVVREAQAVKRASVQYFGASVWRADEFAWALARTPADFERKPRRDPRMQDTEPKRQSRKL